MRILIFGLPRCGTSTLFHFLSEQLPKNYICKSEPYKKETFFIENDLLVKTVLSDKNILINNENLKEHSIRILKDYDKVIYIVRKNVDNIKKSLCKLREHDFVELRNMKKNNILRDLSLKEYTSNQVDEWLDIFYSLADPKQLYYYEEIYTTIPSKELYNLLSYLDIQYDDKLFQKYMHTRNRYKNVKLKRSLV